MLKIFQIMRPYLIALAIPLFLIIINYIVEINASLLIGVAAICIIAIAMMRSAIINKIISTDVDYIGNIVVLTCCIRNFSMISRMYENLPSIPAKISSKFCYMLSRIIDLHQGIVVSSNNTHTITAMWESPDEAPSYHQVATCSLMMIDNLAILNSSLKSEDMPLINIGIGLSASIAAKDDFSEYLTKKTSVYRINLLISEELALSLNKDFIVVEIDRILIKNESVPIYTIIGSNNFLSSNHQIISYQHHNKFLRAYREKRWDVASSIANGLKNAWHNKLKDYYIHMIEQCKYLKDHPPNDEWDVLYKIGK